MIKGYFKQAHLDVMTGTDAVIEMQWFEKCVHNRSYAWEKAPGDEKKDSLKTTTAQ